jgi:hypothetical protein
MSDTRGEAEQLGPPVDLLDDLFGSARAHAATGDSRMWVDDLERVLAVAWDLMTTEQKLRFRAYPDILALVEVAGASPLPL